MDVFTITSDLSFSTSIPANGADSAPSQSESNKNETDHSSFMYEEEQQKYYKESIIINYQRYNALFRSKLVGHILIDDKNIIRDFNKKAKEDFRQLSGKGVKIGASIVDWFEIPHYGAVFQKALQSGLNEILEFEHTGLDGQPHRFQMEIQLFISPLENRLLKCISAVKIN